MTLHYQIRKKLECCLGLSHATRTVDPSIRSSLVFFGLNPEGDIGWMIEELGEEVSALSFLEKWKEIYGSLRLPDPTEEIVVAWTGHCLIGHEGFSGKTMDKVFSSFSEQMVYGELACRYKGVYVPSIADKSVEYMGLSRVLFSQKKEHMRKLISEAEKAAAHPFHPLHPAYSEKEEWRSFVTSILEKPNFLFPEGKL